MSSPHDPASTDLPAVDDHLVTGTHRYEVDDGKLVYVPPAQEPHAVSHGALGALLHAHRAADRRVAIDMLTRVSELSDRAPDAAVYPSARDPATGRRQLEELAFEIVSTETLGDAGKKAVQLSERGVRRVFAIDIGRKRAFEWSRELVGWGMLASNATIEDAALAVPLPIAALIDAVRAEPAIVHAYRARRHPEFLAERAEGREEGRQEGRQEGREEGRAAGREAGRAEGRVAALRSVVTRLLEQQHGPLAERHAAAIATASSEALERALDRLLTASPSDDLFGE